MKADAVRDPLPKADIAYCMHVAPHLSDAELTAMIRNVGRSCRRLIFIDLVRHKMPLILFRMFLAPFLAELPRAMANSRSGNHIPPMNSEIW